MNAGAPAPCGAPRIVLDTNVCLDLLVFADPRVAPLRDALATGRVQGVTSPECRGEWHRVLAYPQLRLDEEAQRTMHGAFDALFVIPPHTSPSGTVLPRCADPDDQKFLELADAAGAHWLLSRDDALLKLARRLRREGRFDILAPGDWVEAYSSKR